jgi:hypothetical protein
MPCHNPPQNPAGFAPDSLYLELDPATEMEFAIGGPDYKREGRGLPIMTTPSCQFRYRLWLVIVFSCRKFLTTNGR